MKTRQSEIAAAAAVRAAMRRRAGSSPRRIVIEIGAVAVVMLAGACGYDSEVYGIYFPSWVIAPALGAVAAVLSLTGIARTRFEPYVPRGILVFVGLTIIYAVLLWGLFFSA